MAARHTIWKWAGVVNDAWGRIKVLAGVFSALTTALLLLWLFVIRNLGVTGTVVLSLAALFGLLALGLLASRLLPAAPEELESEREQAAPPIAGLAAAAPAVAVYVPERPCEEFAHAEGGRCKYCHVQVAATSTDVLKRCHARLLRVEKAINQQWVVDSRFAAPTRLKWANVGLGHPQVEFRDMRPGESALLDVAYTRELMPGRAFIETLDPQPLEPSRELDAGIYLLTMRVLADGRDPVDLTAMLGVRENWQTVTLGSYAGTRLPNGAGGASDVEPIVHRITFFIVGFDERHIEAGGEVAALVFEAPVRARVNPHDLPRELRWFDRKIERMLVVERFAETGFVVREQEGDANIEVKVEARLSRDVPGYEARVINELIWRGLAFQNKVDDRSEGIALTWIAMCLQDWSTECWERLGEAVPNQRGLFHFRPYIEADHAAINEYVALALEDLREILRKVP